MRILFFILTCIILVGSKIIIEDANIAAISHDDIGMIFYIALHNTDNCKYRIFTRMVKCIEEVEVNDKECEMMQLLGGDMGEIRSQCYKNITLLYPNMYLHNRKGYCIIAIKFISEDNQVLEKKTNISFNTCLGSRSGRKQSFMSSYYNKVSYTPCESVDLDPLQNCAPVDCHMKYLGTRSFFNKKWKRCQKVPVCVFDVEKDLPDVGYTPVTNKCIDLERCIKKSDLGPLDNKYAELGDISSYSLMLTAINCHYGKINNQSGVCDCFDGWTSAAFDKEPTLFPIHMCNIELSSWYDSNRTEITFVAFIISVVAVAVAMVVVLISFIMYHLYKCLRSMEGTKPQCYCDLEAGTDIDEDSKNENKKEKKKSGKRTPSKESKESKETKESKDSKTSKGTSESKTSKENLQSKDSKSRRSKESLQSEPQRREEQSPNAKGKESKKKTAKSNEKPVSEQPVDKEKSKTSKKSKPESVKSKPSASTASIQSNTSITAQQPVAPATSSKKSRK